MIYDILEFFLRVFLGTSLVIITFMAIFAVACLFPFILIGAGIYTIWDFVSDRQRKVS
jgi:uncharacterized membrane protein HdeD (DUF308 family)